MQGILFTDLSEICREKELLSPISRLNYWETVAYETKETAGVLLAAKSDNFPAPITLVPNLTGWHRIYVGVVACINQAESNTVQLKLSKDGAYTQFRPFSDIEGAGVEETFWKCAEMTEQDVTLCKLPGGGNPSDCMLGWLRFEPMSEEEIAEFNKEEADFSHKMIYTTNDMHTMAYNYSASTQEEWNMTVESYDQSDVEWVSVENVYMNDGKTPVPEDDFSYNRHGDRNVQKTFPKYYNDDMLHNLVQYAHTKGLKMCVSQRMGEWVVPFPYDDMYFDNSFWKAHPECRCIDRDGSPTYALSYAFIEVQDYVIGMFLRQAANGFDAVELMFNRGIPYVLFEEPFCRLFQQQYGQDPRFLPWTDERIIAIRCQIITGFIKRLREKLNRAGFEKVRIHIRGLHAIYDNQILGIDPIQLAAEHLVDAILVYPQKCRERLNGDVWQESDSTKIDLKKYTKFATESNGSIIWRHCSFAYADGAKDIMAIWNEVPPTESERIAQWVALENEYAVQIYFEIMPRHMSAAEYKRRIQEIYAAGGKRISLWDSYGRVCDHSTWNLIRKAGHKEWLDAQEPGSTGYAKQYRFIRIRDIVVGRFRPNWGT